MSSTPPDLSRLRIHREDPTRAAGGPRPWLWIVLGGLALAASAWALLRARATEVQVATASATVGGAAGGSGITANGYVVARTKASVSAKVLGRLEYLGVSEGSLVREGQVIARIESADYAAALQAARARTRQLEIETSQADRDFARVQQLARQGVIPDAERENAEARYRSLLAQLELARAQEELAAASYENTRIRAPFAGTVLRKDAEVGEIVAPSSAGGGLTRTAVVTMADLGTLEVEVDVNEAYIAQVARGQPARVALDAYPDTSFAGRVRQVVPTADRQKATVLVKVSILDRDPRILPEMGAKVEFVRAPGAAAASAPRRVLVPSAALSESVQGPRVWVVENGKVSARPVDVGPPRGDQVEIRRGLSGGETVVLSPPAELREGARVRARIG
jgi:RND family efflux transporter MFP subunit